MIMMMLSRVLIFLVVVSVVTPNHMVDLSTCASWLLLGPSIETTPNGIHGLTLVTTGNTSLTQGPDGLNAWVFTGQNYAHITNDGTLNLKNDSFTIVTYVYQDTHRDGPIVEWRGWGPYGTHMWIFHRKLFVNLDAHVFSTGKHANIWHTTPQDGKWSFVGVSFNHTSGTLMMWVDDDVMTYDVGVIANRDMDGDLYIGCRPATRVNKFTGMLAGTTLLKCAINGIQINSLKAQIKVAATLPDTTTETIQFDTMQPTTKPPTTACSYTFENADCRFHDIWSGDISYAQCRDACDKRSDCKSFQYRGTCWLKNFVCSKSQLAHLGQRGFSQYTKHCSESKPRPFSSRCTCSKKVNTDSGCGSPRHQTGIIGMISSMNYPNNYQHHADCTWVITVPSRFRIRIHFDSSFSIETHSNCSFDSVSLYEGTSSTVPIGKHCSDKTPADITSRGNKMLVEFKSDQSVVRKGFSLDWTAIPLAASVCGSPYLQSGTSGFISSMNHPNNYQNDTDCSWLITVPDEMRVRLAFDSKFEIEKSDQGCTFDSVTVRGVNTSTGDLGQTYGVFCGSSAPGTFVVDENVIVVSFKSDSTTNLAGFLLKWDAILHACGFPPSPANGTVSLSDQDNVYSKASYSCHSGFELVGRNRQCMPYGRWTGNTPRCQEI